MLTRFNKPGGVKWAFVVTFATTHSLLAAHSGDVPSWLCRNGIDEKPKYKILMKKRLTLFSLLLLFTMTAMAQTEVDGIYYNYFDESDYTVEVVAGGTKYSGDIVIPASISVDGVVYSVTSIGTQAFYDCDVLTSIEIPNSVTSIGYRAFECCSGLTSIEIPTSVTSIGGSAFEYCSGLMSIEIPTSVTEIGKWAFAYCSSLTSIEIPTSVTSIGGYAFYYCSGLTSIVVEEGNSYYDSRENCNAIIEAASNKLIVGCQNTIIPNSVTSIGDYAFYDCDGLTSIEIPNSVTSIGYRAFECCSNLTSIDIPNSVTEIGYAAFSGCSSLTSIEIPTSVTEIGEGAFEYCSGLTSIEIPTSVTSIGNNAFCNCDGLTSIEIPNSVTSIGDYAFYDCDGLSSIEIPNSVTEIGDYAFSGCSSLTSIEIPTSVTLIEYQAFSGCSGLTSITMQRATPPTVGGKLFAECSKLETIYVPVGASEAYNVAPWNKYNIVEVEVTGIESVTLEEWPADVYDLNGRMVKAQAENLDGLPKGVYIVNGKKFVK